MIEIRNLSKVYESNGNAFPVLHDISLSVEEGDFVAIMGRSGCGKTTLLNILGLIDGYSEGQYSFCGIDAGKLSAAQAATLRRDKIGYIYQSFNLIEELTCEENVTLTLGYAGVRTAERKSKAKELLEVVGLLEKARCYPSQLSGGQKQRIAIARAISNHPLMILADEPTGNLDYNNGLEIMNLLQALNRMGTTIVMVTHDDEFASFAQHRFHMLDGKLVSRNK